MPIQPLQNEAEQDLSAKLQSIRDQINITLSTLRDAIVNGTTPTDLLAIYNQLAATLSRNIATWGGTAVTGRDISADLAKLDITLSALRDAIVNGTTPTDLLAVKNEITSLLNTQKNRGAWTHGYITVTTAGTPVQGPNIVIPDGFAVSLIYHPKNTGDVGIGASSAAANLSTGTPVILTAVGQSFAERVTNLNLLWFDVSVSGEKIIYAVEQ